MRSLSLAIVTLAAALAVASCSGPQVREFGRQDAEQLRAFVQEFVTAYNAKDAAKVQSLYSGAAILMPPNASTVRGSEPIQGYYENRFKFDGATGLEIETGDISGQWPLAYVIGSVSVNLKPEGQPERRDRGKILFILRNLANTWRIEISMWSSDLEPVVPAPPAEAEKPKK
jgi:ketosteroid isomerase-like protein